MQGELVRLLDALLPTHSPGGGEQEIDAVLSRELSGMQGGTERDPLGNILLSIPGRQGGPVPVVAAHKDELFTVVRKIDRDGKMWPENVNPPRVHKAKNEALSWGMVYLDCKLDAEALAARGAGIGDRALVGRRRCTWATAMSAATPWSRRSSCACGKGAYQITSR